MPGEALQDDAQLSGAHVAASLGAWGEEASHLAFEEPWCSALAYTIAY